MGRIQVGPSAAGDVLRILSEAYTLRPLSTARRHLSAPEVGPIIVGGSDLHDGGIVDLLRISYQAGHTIALTSANAAAEALLRSLLGHRSGGSLDASIPQADLVAFRRATRPDGRTHESTSFLPPRLAVGLPSAQAKRGLREADARSIEWLSQVFSGTPVVPDPPPGDDGPIQNLLNLANSYQFHIQVSDAGGDSVQIVNSVWAARSFLNQMDLYYILQEIDYHGQVDASPFDRWNTQQSNSLVDPALAPLTIQPSPPTTLETTTLTSGVMQSYGGNIGFNQTQGVNVTGSEGVTISNSESVTVPPVVVNYEGNLTTGETAWNTETTFHATEPQPPPRTVTFFNQWIWEVTFAAYSAGQQNITFTSAATLGWPVPRAPVTATLSSVVPLPFGDTFALQPPVVTSVSPTTVFEGDEFTITGTGLYPSLVTGVLINGEPLDPTQFSTVSDTQITAVAPDTFGLFLPVVVQTTQGVSNDNVTIAIIGFTSSPRSVGSRATGQRAISASGESTAK